ncbi:YoaK family protein [Anaerostipes butyraticus]|uniref:DUF1275 family protein n=1 Tax=Anaerostipes butyraticus TaxID=645466 RepID=A0A916Q8Y1_9FIRM|nr:YoaK family protein [Anaerostipes butyraticus]GFO85050.1 DUF1275 family protein [Anaerostipes butyraticus]
MKSNLQRWIHLNMAVIGGFLGGFAILNHHDLFGSAQTSNLISIAMDTAGHPDSDWLIRIIGLAVYAAALSLTVILPKYTRLPMKPFSLGVDAAAVLITGLLPSDLNDFIALYPLFFAMAIQWCSFSGADGYTASSIFSTNNLRQFITSLTEYLCSKDPKALHKGEFFGKVLAFFHIGVVISYLSCRQFGLIGAWICFLPILTGSFLVWAESNWVALKHFLGHLYIAYRRTGMVSES